MSTESRSIPTIQPASFPGSLPPALNSTRDIAFTIQAATAGELYAAWAAGYAIAGNDGYADNPDADALDNLAEYGLGGAPDNPNDPASIDPVLGDPGAGTIDYIYRRRTDAAARGLDYYLELNTNLVVGSWSTNGYSETGTMPLETGFEAVTNQIPTTEANRFIRLRILIN